jgi:sulfoxide reductase catalytic subunit YedY
MIRSRRSWEIGEAETTPESAFFGRRRFLAGLGGAAAAGAFGWAGPAGAGALDGRLPAPPNVRLSAAETLTPEGIATTYNNFYEFGFSKNIVAASKKLKTSPWRVVIDGLCDHPFEADVDDLLKKVSLEERIYRFRCVEAWSMVVPWTGFALSELVALAGPKPEAKYLRMETFLDPKVAPYQSAAQYPWPYVEGLTIEEAKNDLAFLAVGIYGKPLPTQHGAPIRLVTPWKYGFKSAKSLVKFSFVAKRPETFWEALGPSEYGFWANVNPQVAHPRWSQAQERRLGPDDMVPTRLFNGYADQVAGLYQGLTKERLFM